MKQLLSMFAIAMLLVACGPEKKEQTEETSVEVEAVEVDSTTIGTTTDLEDSVEVVEEVEAEGEEASAE